MGISDLHPFMGRKVKVLKTDQVGRVVDFFHGILFVDMGKFLYSCDVIDVEIISENIGLK